MIRKKVQKIIALALSMSFIGQLVIENQAFAAPSVNKISMINNENIVQPLAIEPYVQNFDNGDISGWSKVWGGGTISAEEGGLAVQGGNWNTSSDGKQFTMIVDNNSPEIKDGQLETDLKVRSHAVRMSLVIRYVDNKNYECIGYDVGGTWVYHRSTNGSETNTVLTSSGPSLAQNTEHKIKVQYAGTNLKLFVDDEKIYEGNVLTEDRTGKIGIRGWGYTDNYSYGIYDNLTLSQYKEVSVTPNKQYVLYSKAGTYDIPINLSNNENVLIDVNVKDEALIRNVDYTLEGNVLTIKKEYITKVKENGTTNMELVFEDGFKSSFILDVQLPPEEYIEYTRDFTNGINGMSVVVGSANISSENNKLSIPQTSNAIVIDENSPELYNSEVEFTVDPLNDNANFGAVLRYAGENSWTYIGVDGSSSEWGSTWYVTNSNGARRNLFRDSSRIYANRVKPYTVKIKLVDKIVTVYLDGVAIYNSTVDEVTTEKGKAGIRFHSSNGGKVGTFSVTTASNIEESNIEEDSTNIESGQLKVTMDKNFPRVISYEMNSNKLYGQEIPNYVVDINTKRYVPKVTSDFEENKAIYTVSVDEIGVSFDVIYEVIDNVLNMNIVNINEDTTKVYTINFPQNNLVSVRSTQEGAHFKSQRVNQSHTSHFQAKIDRDLANTVADTTYDVTNIAIVNDNNLAASITNSCMKSNQEVAYQTVDINGEYTSTGIWTNEYSYRGLLDSEVIAEPWAKVVITGDRNSDSKVDYFDGAIAYRDDIREERLGTEIVQNSYSSVAMNVGSVAQYPFLRILDNIKKFDLGTDGFGQNIIIKGYQSEGHDSAHPDFANISERAGGEDDFRTLLEEAEKYNATIGVHINHTEAYPEATQYGSVVSNTAGWSWYDSAKQIIRENDILDQEEGMEKRLDDLAEIAPGIDMVYVDVYSDDRWPAHKLSSKLNDLGWAIASEYPQAFSSTSVWAHHLTSEYNNAGDLYHFVNHQTQETFSYSNLFRGLRDRVNGFLGWQGASDYNETIQEFFTDVLPNKYLMNFPLMQWESNTKAILGENNEVVTTYENGKNIITKDGKVIADGNKIFIPWNVETEDKIYHWTDATGSTTWELPSSWEGLNSVVLYKLSDEGKTEKTLIEVINGKITLNTTANTGYVIYKEETEDTRDMEWSTGSPVKDMGFDSHSWEYSWNKYSTFENTNHINFVNNSKGNTTIRVEGNNGADAIITQTMTGLVGGQTYSASVWMEVSEGRKSEISVTTPDGKTVSNYTDRSNVKYGSTHNDKLNTYYQRVKITFTQPEGETTAEIKLSIEQGEENSWVNLDDVRVTEIGVTEKGDHYYFEDFENVDQGYGPFESTKSDNSHLSETNAPYTNDTIDGRYSLKIRSGDYMRTLPHRIRFEPNTTYRIGLDHLSWADNAFILGVKSDKASEAGDRDNSVLVSKSISRTGTVEVEFTTGNYDDYYIDITRNAATEYIVDNLYVDKISVEEADKAELQKLYDDNKDKEDSYYLEDAWRIFTEALNSTKAVLDNKEATEEEINAANISLQIAIINLKTCDLNGNSKVDIGDVAMISKYYGEAEKNNSDIWEILKDYDINNDKVIDAKDISLIINKIMNK